MMYLVLKLSDAVFIQLINVKMPTNVGILTFMSKINFMLSRVEHEKGCITSRPDLTGMIQRKRNGINYWRTVLCQEDTF